MHMLYSTEIYFIVARERLKVVSYVINNNRVDSEIGTSVLLAREQRITLLLACGISIKFSVVGAIPLTYYH